MQGGPILESWSGFYDIEVLLELSGQPLPLKENSALKQKLLLILLFFSDIPSFHIPTGKIPHLTLFHLIDGTDYHGLNDSGIHVGIDIRKLTKKTLSVLFIEKREL